jgi:peroxiredoxin
MIRTVIGSALVAMLTTILSIHSATAIEVGQKAPDFVLPSADGAQVKLNDVLGKGPVVIYTFVQAFTKPCGGEITGFDGALSEFEKQGVQVIGISADYPGTLAAYAKSQNIKHVLLGDFFRKMLPAYELEETDQKSVIYHYAKRAYLVLDRNGIVRYKKIVPNPLEVPSIQEVLAAVKSAAAQ